MYDYKQIFSASPSASWWRKSSTPSISELQQIYNISTPVQDKRVDETIIEECDDAGILCLPLAEYNKNLDQEFSNFSKQDSEFLRTYIDKRVSLYMSPRRGASKGLRGYRYYDMMRQGGVRDIHEVFISSFKEDCDAYNFLARNKASVKYINYIVLEHLKSGLIRIMNAYLHMCVIGETEFSRSLWDSMDVMARNLWGSYLSNIIESNWEVKSTLSFREAIDLASEIEDKYLWKVRELDSPKTLIRFASVFLDKVAEKGISKTQLCPMYYGGIEIPYAINALNQILRKTEISLILPIIFSTNKVKTGLFNIDRILSNNAVKQDYLFKIIPKELHERIDPETYTFILDNNITSGYSLFIARNTLRNICDNVEIAVAEVNINEMLGLHSGKSHDKDRHVLLDGDDFFCRPVGQYISCFGLKDSSRVIDRIRTVLSIEHKIGLIGYDFDGTLFETGKAHKAAWSYVIKSLDINLSIQLFPDLNGLTNHHAAEILYDHLNQDDKDKTSKQDFAKLATKFKEDGLLKACHHTIPITKGVNALKEHPAETKVLITNNFLSFCLKTLKKHDLLRYFSYLICSDYLYICSNKNIAKIAGKNKPDVEAYTEAMKYLNLPNITKYYGDHELIDGIFAQKLGVEFVHVKS